MSDEIVQQSIIAAGGAYIALFAMCARPMVLRGELRGRVGRRRD